MKKSIVRAWRWRSLPQVIDDLPLAVWIAMAALAACLPEMPELLKAGYGLAMGN